MMRLLRFSRALIVWSIAVSAGAQTVALTQNALTNKDVFTLAKAGFNENFIMDTIAMSRTQFDTSVNGLADMAKEGLTERLIRFMMTAGTEPFPTPSPGGAQGEPGITGPVMASPAMSGGGRARGRVIIVKPSAIRQALSTQTPYYEWTSMFWGLWRKKVGVGSAPRAEQVVSPPLGGFYNQVRKPMTSPTPVMTQPANSYYEAPTRYVVLQ
ncbi:MAG TPA: hypothetical protein VGH38_19880 [Bryobacteraceae bacterium]|jgi:hypothetical protein